MKRFAAFCLSALLLLSLFSCGSGYAPVKSTDTEKKCAVTMTANGEKVKVPFELFRAFLLAYRESAKDDADLEAKIVDAVADVYAPILLAKENGFDAFSKKADKSVKEYVRVSVEGGTLFGDEVTGYENYEDYLASLSDLGLNYGAQDLLFRSALASEEIELCYAGTEDDDVVGKKITIGKINPTDAQLLAFYNADTTARVIWVHLSPDAFDADGAENVRATAAGKSGEAAIVGYLIGQTTDSFSEVENGHLVTQYSLDNRYYGELTALALATPVGQVASRTVEISGTAADGYYVLFRAAKSQSNFTALGNGVRHAYVENEIGKDLAAVKAQLTGSAAIAEWIRALDYKTVTIGTK